MLIRQQLLLAVDDILITKNRRLQALSLLSSFVRLQPPHLHLVLETQVIKHLHSCLLMDQSPTVVDLALTILIMFIPHITTAIVSDLPTLFLIYSRILCWDQYVCDAKYRTSSEYESDGSDMDRPQVRFDPSWAVIDSPDEGRQAFTPKPNYLFTFLYGLFPLNFMNFIRKPKRYLKMKGLANSGELDLHQELIRLRSDIHRSQHKLHANFFMTTAEDELTEDRWLTSEPAELVSECLSLCIAVAVNLGDPGPPPSTKLPPLPRSARPRKVSRATQHAIEDESVLPPSLPEMRPPSSRNTMSTTITASSNGNDFKFPPRHSSHNSLRDHVSLLPPTTTHTPKPAEDATSPVEAGPRRFPVSAPPSPPRSVATTPTLPRLQSFAQILSRYPIPNPSLPGGDAYNTAILQREVMLLKNDINFERFQKQKYIEQIGHMQQKQMTTLAAETDAQGAASANKVLRGKLAASDDRHEQLRREMAASRALAKKVEDQLTAKLRALREDEKQWNLDAATLQRALDASRREVADLRARCAAADRSEHAARDALAHLTVDAAEIDALRAAVQAASARLRSLEAREAEFTREAEEGALARAQLQAARQAAARAEGERERQRRAFEVRVQQLEAAASAAASAAAAATAQAAAAGAMTGSSAAALGGANLPPSVQTMLDSAIAARESKISQLRRSYEALQHRFLDLELRNQELQGHGPRPGSVLSLTRYAEDYMSSPHQNPFAAPSSPPMNGSPSLQPLPRSLSLRRTGTDPSSRAFPPPAPSSGASTASSPTSTSTPSISSSRMGGRGGAFGALTEDAERELEVALAATTHDFHISPTESLASGAASTVRQVTGPGSRSGSRSASRSASRSGSVSTGSAGPATGDKRDAPPPVVKSFGRGRLLLTVTRSR